MAIPAPDYSASAMLASFSALFPAAGAGFEMEQGADILKKLC